RPRRCWASCCERPAADVDSAASNSPVALDQYACMDCRCSARPFVATILHEVRPVPLIRMPPAPLAQRAAAERRDMVVRRLGKARPAAQFTLSTSFGHRFSVHRAATAALGRHEGSGRMNCRALLRTAVTASALAMAGLAALPAHAQGRDASVPIEPVPRPHEVHARIAPLKTPRSALVEFDVAPFPYDGVVPRTHRPFFDVTDEDGRRGHRSARAGVLWEDSTYSDRRALLFMPAGFDVRRPGLIVVFLHGNRATVERDVAGRQRVAAQIAQANVNAVLV